MDNTDNTIALEPGLANATPEYLSIYGTLFLAGSMAAARNKDRATTRTFLAEAEESAGRLGADANHLWTAFGPTNVAIHRVSTAVELGDLQAAVDLGPRVDVSALPVERRIRHRIEIARAYSAWNRRDEALTILLDAERDAPEQIRYHFISRQLVMRWIRQQRGKPSHHLADLAKWLTMLAVLPTSSTAARTLANSSSSNSQQPLWEFRRLMGVRVERPTIHQSGENATCSCRSRLRA